MLVKAHLAGKSKDDGISMLLSKQSEYINFGLSAPDERAHLAGKSKDDGISMLLSKQSEYINFGLSAPDERARKKCAAERPAILSNQQGSIQTFSFSGHLCKSQFVIR